MKSRMARTAVIVAEVAGVLVAATIAAVAFLFWRVQASPVDLTWTSPAFRTALNATGLGDAVRDIGAVKLSKIGNDGGYRLDFANVSLGGKRMEASAEIPKVVVDFYPADIVAGKIGPRRLLVDGAELRIVRRADRKLKLDFGGASGKRGRAFEALTGGAYFREAFERAALSNVTITFVDENSGRTWRGEGGEAAIDRTKSGYSATLASRFAIGSRAAALRFTATYDLAADRISSKLSLTNAPVGDLVAVFFNENAELFTSPVSGSALVEVSGDGTVLHSRIDLQAGEGVLTLGGWSTSVSKFAAVAGFDPARNEFAVDRIEWEGSAGSGALAGRVSLTPAAQGKGIERIGFALQGEPIAINQPELFTDPWTIDRSTIEGVYDVGAKSIAIAGFKADFFGVSLTASGSYAPDSERSPAIAADLRIDGALDPQTLLKFWPKRLVLNVRSFIETRMPRGRLSNVALAMNLEAGAIGADGIIPDEALTLTFRADEAEVIYAPGMTPLVGVAGSGALKGNSFRFDAERGAVAKVRVSSGQVEIPVLAPKGQPTYFRFKIAGDAGEVLRILNQEPLKVLADTQFSPEQFSGPVTAQVEVQRPNLNVAPQDSYRYKGVATFSGLSVDGIFADASLTGGKGRLNLETSGMVVTGEARLGDAPLTIEWKQRFYGGGDKTIINVSGVANSGTADLFRIPTRQLAQGDIPFTAKAIGGVNAFRELQLNADFTSATLLSETLGWMKPQGTPAKGSALVAFSPEGTNVSDLFVEGEGISIRGEAAFAPGGAIRSFSIPTFRLNEAASLALEGSRTEGEALSVDVSGDYLNAGEMIRTLIEDSQTGAGKTPFALKARIDRVDLRVGAGYRDASLDFSRSADRIDTFNFTADGASGKRLSVALDPILDADGVQTMLARSDDVGAMLAGIFGLTSVRGGEGSLNFAFTPGAANAPKTGALEAKNLRVVKAPLLAKIFAAGSLTGLADLMNGDGIELKNAMARFAIEKGEVRIAESRATGPSVGITAQGSFGIEGERAVALKGAVAPVYSVNSLLGKAPLIGDLFVNRKGEGLLALSYDVAGPANEPRVTVNPLSAFTPGVFRRMFEGRAQEAETPPPSDETR